MSYTALYRKFRPDSFSQVKGQDHIVTTLTNQIANDRMAHAYLFCGTRGTGKTTVAKIFAKAINCEHPINGNPCNECELCKAISKGSSMNVIEIDAASNNGVDNIRQIRDEVQYSPAEGRYKVYIIDEVHMLSIGAFNALLKTLEEPPAYVIFILATTEAHKLPITILSRCQRYDFKRISIDTIQARLTELIEKEGVKAETKALHYIAKAADGSLRDGLSLLDQCIAFYMNKDLTYENVLEVLGAVDTEVFSRILKAIVTENVYECISILDEIMMKGRDLNQFVNEFIEYMRSLMLVKVSDNIEDIIDASKERLEAYKIEASELDEVVIMRYIRVLSELTNQIRFAVNKRVLVEIALIKLAKPAMEKDYEALVNRIEVLEKKVEDGVIAYDPYSTPENKKQPIQQPVKPMQLAVQEEIQAAADNWDQISNKLEPMIKVKATRKNLVVLGGNRLGIAVDDFGFDMLNKPSNIAAIETAISTTIDRQVVVEFKRLEKNATVESSFQTLVEKVNFNVEKSKEEI